MSISIICPLYKAESYIEKLHSSIMNQKNIEILEIKYILTECGDKTEEILNRLGAYYEKISPVEFSHSLTREHAALTSKGDIIVFITQDIIINDELWLYKLTKNIREGNCQAAFSRQICDNNSIEKYTRMKNYPSQSRVVCKEDIEKLGIMTFFFSDVASAIDRKIFEELNGYDGKDLLTNEDMYFAHKLIKNGYKIMYCAEAEVIHSHQYTFKQLFKRYFDQGVFLRQHSYLGDYGANSSAISLLKYILTQSLKEKNYKVLVRVVPNFAARFLGNKFGQKYEKISRKKIREFSSNQLYWDRIN
ncbi:glycosyltransferase [Oceanirhabdus sp. W0125-5]|uniref:glycosyltransferase n=1 Tax=Oceanirhabdus sp. W0125-5 TaxID=2999116 RepID=UPI0022F2F615|nr:glycosyltransferase [Oceanirhabdus sp. W0125-5]WBW98658.1 glycosyltransferase [Oceanirhabdus sp. W0125-5]